MDIPIIETDRLRLRGWSEEDLPAFTRLNANPDFMTYFGSGEPISMAESFRVMASIVGHWHLKGFGLWLVEERATGAFVGRVGLLNMPEWPSTEVGWGIHPDFWGRGYATEAAIASAQWGFENLPLDFLISIIDPRNAPSIAVAERIGEQFDRTEFFKDRDCSIYKVMRHAFYEHIGSLP